MMQFTLRTLLASTVLTATWMAGYGTATRSQRDTINRLRLLEANTDIQWHYVRRLDREQNERNWTQAVEDGTRIRSQNADVQILQGQVGDMQERLRRIEPQRPLGPPLILTSDIGGLDQTRKTVLDP